MRWGSSAGYRSQNETSYLREGDILRGLLNQPGNRNPEQGGDPGHRTARADQARRPLPELRRVQPRHWYHFSFQKQPHTLNKLIRETGG